METVPLSRRGFLTVLGASLLSGVGCRTLDHCKSACGITVVPPTHNAQLAATWNNKIVSTPDPTQGGAPIIGLAGRIYLFSTELESLQPADGTIVVTMWDHTPLKYGDKPKRLEEWNFDSETLKKLMKRDAFGWGYTLFLPWGSYRPDLKQVHLQVVYSPLAGEPIHAPGQPLTIDHSSNDKNAPVVPAVANKTGS